MERQITVDLPNGYELEINVDLHKLSGYDSVLVVYGLRDDAGEMHMSTAAFIVRSEGAAQRELATG